MKSNRIVRSVKLWLSLAWLAGTAFGSSSCADTTGAVLNTLGFVAGIVDTWV